MTTRLIPLTAAALALSVSSAAFAHDHGSQPVPHGYPGTYSQPVIQGQSQPYPQGYPQAYPQPYPGSYPMPAPTGAPSGPDADRARGQWMSDCVDRYFDQRRGGDGDVAGAAIGAIVGGVAGNRIAGKGDRLGGTLLGAGVGGLAGLAIGSAIDRSKLSKEEAEAYDYCENYLGNYYGRQPGYAQGGYPQPYYPMNGQMAYAYPAGPPMMMMPVMIPVQKCHQHEVVETVVERPVRRVIYERQVKTVPATKYIKQQPTKYVK